jgi:hypothetical protein
VFVCFPISNNLILLAKSTVKTYKFQIAKFSKFTCYQCYLVTFKQIFLCNNGSNPTMAPHCAPTKKPAAKQPKQIVRDAKGKICNWDGESPDAQFLKLLVENGAVEGLTAGQIQMDP